MRNERRAGRVWGCSIPLSWGQHGRHLNEGADGRRRESHYRRERPRRDCAAATGAACGAAGGVDAVEPAPRGCLPRWSMRVRRGLDRRDTGGQGALQGNDRYPHVRAARHEQAAGFMAATYGRFTGKAGVCLSTLGPGATNFVTSAAYAQLGGMPMMMITGQKPVKKSKQGRFQILDVVDMMGPITKYTHQIVASDNIPSKTREAFRLAEDEKPGAVHLELPEDIADEQTDEQPMIPRPARRAIAEEKAIRSAVESIEAATAPLLVVGAGANRKVTGNMLTALVEDFGIPFVTTQLGKGVVDERHPLFMGNAALSAGDYVHRAIEASDLIIEKTYK